VEGGPAPGYRDLLVLHYAAQIDLLLQRDQAAAATALAALLEIVPADWPKRPQVAAHLARCAALVREDQKISEAERNRRAAEYGDQAMRCSRWRCDTGPRTGTT